MKQNYINAPKIVVTRNSGVGSVIAGDLTTSTGLSVTGGTGAIIGSGVVLSGVNAVADGSTKGVAAFATNDFNSSNGIISIDYANGQAASTTVKGFLTSAGFINLAAQSGTNTGDETTATIKTKLGTASATSGGYLTSAGWATLLGGSGAESFLELTDTPSSYAGQSGKVVSVKANELGLEFTTNSGGAFDVNTILTAAISSLTFIGFGYEGDLLYLPVVDEDGNFVVRG